MEHVTALEAHAAQLVAQLFIDQAAEVAKREIPEASILAGLQMALLHLVSDRIGSFATADWLRAMANDRERSLLAIAAKHHGEA